MKKLTVAALVAGSMLMLGAADAKTSATTKAPAATTAAASADAKKPTHQISPEQREKMRAMREKYFAQRRAEMESKAVAIIKKYGLDDAKAKALYEELTNAIRPQRRPRPAGKKPAEKKN